MNLLVQTDGVGQCFQWLHFFGLDEMEFADKVEEVLQARVNVGLRSNRLQLLEVVIVDMDKDAEHATEDIFADGVIVFLGTAFPFWEERWPHLRSGHQSKTTTE